MSNKVVGEERPLAVISEEFVRKHLSLPVRDANERFSFGEDYDGAMCEAIDRHLEVSYATNNDNPCDSVTYDAEFLQINTDDSVCYVGDTRGTFAPLLQSRFCILKPVTSVVPGHIHYEESPAHTMLPFR